MKLFIFIGKIKIWLENAKKLCSLWIDGDSLYHPPSLFRMGWSNRLCLVVLKKEKQMDFIFWVAKKATMETRRRMTNSTYMFNCPSCSISSVEVRKLSRTFAPTNTRSVTQDREHHSHFDKSKSIPSCRRNNIALAGELSYISTWNLCLLKNRSNRKLFV